MSPDYFYAIKKVAIWGKKMCITRVNSIRYIDYIALSYLAVYMQLTLLIIVWKNE